jgi:hypothetical protein
MFSIPNIQINQSITQIVSGSLTYYFGHDTLSVASNTNYFIGNSLNLAPVTVAQDGRRLSSLTNGRITHMNMSYTTGGTQASGESNTYIINNVNTGVSSTVTSTMTIPGSNGTSVFTLATPLILNFGDRFEIQWNTPTFSSNPTAFRQQFNILVEIGNF